MLEEILSQVEVFWDLYKEFLLIIGMTGFVSFFFTPITGVLAERWKVIDAPSHLRGRNDQTRQRRIHSRVMPNLGGLAIVVAFAVGIAYATLTEKIDITQRQAVHIIVGGILIVGVGFWDSIRDIPAKNQFLYQILAAFIVTLGGVKIEYIEILKTVIDFNIGTWDFTLFGAFLSISPLADLITILWIVGLINAINWVSGIDGLAASMSVFAAATLMFIGVKYDSLVAATIAAVLTGSILGFLPYNLPPAKTFNGSIGDMLQGYILAILAIISGAKLSASIIILALPILDAAWVIFGRLMRHRGEIKSPMDLLQISDKTHLHHRFMELGFSVRQTLAVESLIFLGFCITAYYLAGFSQETIYMMVVLLVCLSIFVLLALLNSGRKKRKHAKQYSEPQVPRKAIIIEEDTPEDRYAY